MTLKPVKRTGRIVFAIAVILVFAAIVATLLLANGGRNLHALLDHYHIEWRAADIVPAATPAVPAASKGKRLAAQPLQLPRSFFRTQDPQILPVFTRQINVSGAALCAALNGAGIGNDGWKQSAFDSGTFECTSERTDAPRDPADPASSFFLIIKGRPDGIVTSLRVKLILGPTPAAAAMQADLTKTLQLVVDATGWRDFAETAAAIGRLENVDVTGFGMRLTFAREVGDERRFNLIVTPVGRSPQLLRTRAFFDRDRWIPPSTATAVRSARIP